MYGGSYILKSTNALHKKFLHTSAWKLSTVIPMIVLFLSVKFYKLALGIFCSFEIESHTTVQTSQLCD